MTPHIYVEGPRIYGVGCNYEEGGWICAAELANPIHLPGPLLPPRHTPIVEPQAPAMPSTEKIVARKTPCCGYEFSLPDPGPIYWNPYNNAVQCHACGTAFYETVPLWRCFHCGFATSNVADAQAHFGERDDASEFTPLCNWWQTMAQSERAQEFQNLIRELEAEREENDRLRAKLAPRSPDGHLGAVEA